MEKLFGTDGIRGKANQFPMEPELILNIARSVSAFFVKKGRAAHKKAIIAMDTRSSGQMIESALTAGFTSMGFDVELAGVLPTPGLAFLTEKRDVDFSVMISASHNPYFDNGIKFFKGNGKKLSDADQDEITEIFYKKDYISLENKTGQVSDIKDTGLKTYLELFKEYSNEKEILNGLNIVLDTANGACFKAGSAVFNMLGADVKIIFNSPDGFNINDNCGSEHTGALSKKVMEEGADFGLAFDGDGDRLIAVDDKGERITGDQILAIISMIKNQEKKEVETIVSTIMSNIGLGIFLDNRGIKHIKADVGDRYVYEAMVNENAKIGGEDSGHLIFLDYQTTGDGILSGVILSELIKKTGEKLSKLKQAIQIYPQKLVNVEVSSKPDLKSIPEIQNSIKEIEEKLGKKGRVLVRYSGTQNYCRVMVEAETEDLTEKSCAHIAEAVEKSIG